MARTSKRNSKGTGLVRLGKAALARQDFWQSFLAGQLTANTRRAYQADLRAFAEFIGGAGHLAQVDREAVIAYRSALVNDGLSPATINRRLSSVRQLMREAFLRDLIPANPANGIRGLKVDRDYSPTAALSVLQVAQVLDAIDASSLKGKRDLALLSLLARSGMRRDEAARVKVGDFTQDSGHTILPVEGKGGKTRKVKVGADLLKALRSWIAAAGLQPSDPLFPAMGKGDRVLREKAMSTQGIADVVKARVSSALGEEWRARISPHSLRHSFITIALQAGCPLHRVQYTVGHADPRTTERYDRLRESLEDNASDYVAKALASIS